MNIKKLAIMLCIVTIFLFALSGVSSMRAEAESLKIAIPNDATNEGRALLLLQSYGLLTLKEEAGLNASIDDIIENPRDIDFYRIEAAAVPSVLQDVDYGIINRNYAVAAGLNEALLYENGDSPYVNVVSVKAENANSDISKALAAAVLSERVKEYFDSYNGIAISVVEEPTNGYDATVNYEALRGTVVKMACAHNPHSYVLEIAKEILAEKGIKLEITVVDDYVTPNIMVDAGDVYANFFAHIPYQEAYNNKNGTNLTTIARVHLEPMGIYAGKQDGLSALFNMITTFN